MTELPPDWREVPLASVAEVRLGRQRSPKNHAGDQMRPYVRAANVSWSGLRLDDVKQMNFTDSEMDTFRLKPGDLLLGEASGSPSEVGKPALWRGEIADCAFQNTLVRVRPRGPDPEYLLHYFRHQAVSGGFAAAARGVGIRHLGSDALAKWRLPLPPLSEQRRIAEMLDRADALRAKRQEALILLDNLTQSIFLKMFGDPDASRPDLVPLETLCSRITDGTHQSPKWAENGVPFLFISNILSGEIGFDTAKFVSTATHADLTRRCPIEKGDVLYSTVGSFGIPAVVRTDRPFAFQRHIAHLKPLKSVEPDFLAAMLASSGLRRQAVRAVRGVAQPTINLADIRKFRVVAPPVKEQQRFAMAASRVRAQRGTCATALAGAQCLFSSLQQRAFAGEL